MLGVGRAGARCGPSGATAGAASEIGPSVWGNLAAESIARIAGGVIPRTDYPATRRRSCARCPVAPVPPYVGYGWGYGWGGHGFGFFGFLGGLLFLFLLIGLIRAAFGGHRRGWGPGGSGSQGWGDWRRDAWEQRVKATHDALHREANGGPDKPSGS